jgi:phospholipid-translocating P-type ATPase (flippase)
MFGTHKHEFHDSMILGEPLLSEDTMEQKSESNEQNNQLINSHSEGQPPSNSLDPQQRLVYLFGSDEKEKKIKYPRNIVTTSRYTLLTFLPKSLLEQFRRLANVYFLVIGIIAIIGTYSNYYLTSIAPDAILSPMVIVISISMIKDGIEDIKRHQSDMKVNSKPAKAVTPDGSIQLTQRQHLKVGSLVVFQRDDEVPADVVVLQCGGIQGSLCYVETAAIDGETNLKIRQPALSHLPTIVQMPDIDATLPTTRNPNKITKSSAVKVEDKTVRSSSLSLNNDRSFVFGVEWLRDRVRIEAEPPNDSIYRFNGCLYLKSPNTTIVDESAKPEIIPLSDKNLLLRGSVVRATEWCVGVVVYTGRETKLSLNSKRPPSKLSSVDRIVNRTLLTAISVMIAVCVISMIFSIVWNSNNQEAKYICLKSSDLDEVYPTGGGCEDSSTSSALTIFTFATLYNNFVCISMYVSLEMVYLCQAFFLNQDLNLYDEGSDTRAESHSSGLCADLGQIQYILSDKTGTLTKNVMKLRRVALLNRIFGAPISILPDKSASVSSIKPPTNMDDSTSINSIEQQRDYDELTMLHPRFLTSTSSSKSIEAEQEILKDFLRVLTVCNNVMLMPDDHGVLNITDLVSIEAALQAESADEVALVLAAALYSRIYLTARSNTSATIKGLNSMKLNDDNDSETWEILAVNEFESDRKRMSILVRCNHRHLLLCKGADSSMFTNCEMSAYTKSILEQTERFASTGLRTLIAAKKELSEEEAERWLASYLEAKMSVSRRDEKLSACAHAIEKHMDILGCIGIEDELQDGVPDAIRKLQDTGLNVWMITGDKAETAIAIGKMCALVNEQHNIQRFISLGAEEIYPALLATERAIEEHRQLHSSSQSSKSLAKELSTMTILTTPSPMTSIDLEANHRPIISEINPMAFKALALVIDGTTLERIWISRELRLKFSSIMSSIPTVIACRVSPLQKASLVRMIKTSPAQPVTLAIGDGANDVGMINEARVGVGISGKEGRHAANASDFAISQFRFLVPLLLDHGRYNYIRCSKLVLYSFYKNLLLVSILFYYCIYSGFSGTIPLVSLVFTGYNFYLGLPIIVIGALDIDVPKTFSYEHAALAYDSGRKGELLNSWNMLRWCLWGFFMGFMIFVMCIRLIGGMIYVSGRYNDGSTSHLDIEGVGFNLSSNGVNGGIYVEGFAMYTIIVFAMQYKAISMTRTRTSIFWASIAISMFGYFLFAYLYGVVDATLWYNVMPTCLKMSGFWIGLFSIPAIIMLFDDAVEILSGYLFPSSMTIIRKLYEDDQKIKLLANIRNNTR